MEVILSLLHLSLSLCMQLNMSSSNCFKINPIACFNDDADHGSNCGQQRNWLFKVSNGGEGICKFIFESFIILKRFKQFAARKS